MKPPEQVKAEFVRRWLERAEADWRLCHRLVADPEPYPEAIAFHCQQAAEKYLKACLTWQQVEFPKTHDIGELNALLPGGLELPMPPMDQERLTDYAVLTRYPGDWEPITRSDAEQAVALARQARDAIRLHLPEGAVR